MTLLPLYAFAAGVVLLATRTARADSLIRPNDVIAICGDSITEQRIYSVFIEDYLLMCHPTPGQRIAQFGWWGQTAEGFHSKIQADLFPFKPTVVTTCFGMNDGGYQAVQKDTLDNYRQKLTDLVTDLHKGGVRDIVIGSPGCVDSGFDHSGTTPATYNETLRSMTEVAKEVAQKSSTAFTDIHSPMMDVMAKAKAAYGDAYQFVAGQGVHPSANGHLVMAAALLKGLGCDGAIGTVTLNLDANTGEGSPGQKIISFAKGTAEIESSRYPFCFTGDPDKPDQTSAATVKFTTFNEDLNRYLLVVKGLKSTKAKVTWSNPEGTVSVVKEFAATDLATGINLAAAFIGTNPFSDAFGKVDVAVQAQQANEVNLVKAFLDNLPAFKVLAPGREADFDRLAGAALDRDATLFQAATALVTPVRHTIKVEPIL